MFHTPTGLATFHHHASPALLSVPHWVGSDDQNSISLKKRGMMAFFTFLCTAAVRAHHWRRLQLWKTMSSYFFRWSTRWCLQGHFCCVRFWNVFVIFTAPKSTPVPFLVIYYPLSIIFASFCGDGCIYVYPLVALHQWKAHPDPRSLCLLVYRVLCMDYMAAAYLFVAHTGLKDILIFLYITKEQENGSFRVS